MKVYMDQIGDSMDEYELVEWLVNEGEVVQKGDVLCTVEVGKATVDLEASVSGTIRNIQVRSEEQLLPGALLCEIEE